MLRRMLAVAAMTAVVGVGTAREAVALAWRRGLVGDGSGFRGRGPGKRNQRRSAP